jgi:hypothetical protein
LEQYQRRYTRGLSNLYSTYYTFLNLQHFIARDSSSPPIKLEHQKKHACIDTCAWWEPGLRNRLLEAAGGMRFEMTWMRHQECPQWEGHHPQIEVREAKESIAVVQVHEDHLKQLSLRSPENSW